MPENTVIPLYQQIKDDIKSAIEQGKYEPKEQIPTEPELSAEYSVSRVTVRRAVEELCGEGYLVKQQGRAEFFRRMDFPDPGIHFVGSNKRAIWETLVPDDPEFRQEMLMGYRAYRHLHPMPYRELLNPQVPGLFRTLKEKGLKIGIASSSYLGAVEEVARPSGTEVDFLISGEQCSAHKPDPEIYLRSLEVLGLAAAEALAVEDSPAGITAAKRAGLRVCAIKPRPELTLDQSGADVPLDQLNDVLNVL